MKVWNHDKDWRLGVGPRAVSAATYNWWETNYRSNRSHDFPREAINPPQPAVSFSPLGHGTRNMWLQQTAFSTTDDGWISYQMRMHELECLARRTERGWYVVFPRNAIRNKHDEDDISILTVDSSLASLQICAAPLESIRKWTNAVIHFLRCFTRTTRAEV